MYNILYCYCLVRMLIHDYPCFFDLLFSRWYYSTGFSLQTVVAVSVNVHIIRNPCITGVIRDVMFTLIAYATVNNIFPIITTIVSNLLIFKTGTSSTAVNTGTPWITIVVLLAAVGTRSFSDDGIFHIFTTITIIATT